MGIRHARSAAAVAALLMLAGCSAALPSGHHDACTFHASWVAEGSPSDDGARLTRVLNAAIESDTDGSVAAAVVDLIDAVGGGDAQAVDTASDTLTAACIDAGWEPVEG